MTIVTRELVPATATMIAPISREGESESESENKSSALLGAGKRVIIAIMVTIHFAPQTKSDPRES